MDEGYTWVFEGKELSVEPRSSFEDTSVGPNICEIESYGKWEGDMGSKKGQGDIVPIEGTIWWDFAGKGSWLKNFKGKKMRNCPGQESNLDL